MPYRRRCFRDSRHVLRSYLGQLIASGATDLAGLQAASLAVLGAIPVQRIIRCLPNDPARPDFMATITINGQAINLQTWIMHHRILIEQISSGFRQCFAGLRAEGATSDMDDAARWILRHQARLMSEVIPCYLTIQLSTATGNVPLPRSHDELQIAAVLDFWNTMQFPSLAVYCEHPTVLYWKAKNRDAVSLHRLVALDPAVLELGDFTGSLIAARRRPQRQHMAEALSDDEAQPLSVRDLKLLSVGRLVERAQQLGGKLDRPKVQRLFDAIARDLSGGSTRIDPDIGSMSEETLRKAVKHALATAG